MSTVLLITTDDKFREIKFENGLEFFYKNIGCDLIELVFPRALCEFGGLDDNFIMVVDEEGLLKDAPKLNIYASAFYGSPIYGNVIIAKDGGEEFEGLTKSDQGKLSDAIARLLFELEKQYFEGDDE